MGVTLKVLRRGTHRSASLDDTLQRALRLAPVMGITRVANVTGLDSVGIPVVMVCRPNSRSVAVSQGKGIDLASARASGLMEAVELYHAETITLPLRLATYEELRYQHNVVEVDDLPRGFRIPFSSIFAPALVRRKRSLERREKHLHVLPGNPVRCPASLAHSCGYAPTSFWNRGSFRSPSNIGSSRRSAGVSGMPEASAPVYGIDKSFCKAAIARSGSPVRAATRRKDLDRNGTK